MKPAEMDRPRLKATVLMALFTVRSERQFCEQLTYNLLFRWFLDMDMTEPGWDYTTFSRNRQRRLEHDVASKFDPEAQLARKGKGKEAKLAYSAHALMENRNGLLIDFRVDSADGRAECRNALVMLARASPGSRRATVGADKGYDHRGFVADCRKIGVTPHSARCARRPAP